MKYLGWFVSLTVVTFACTKREDAGGSRGGVGDSGRIEATALPERATTDGPRFAKLDASDTGIDFVHRWTPRDEHAHQLDNAVAGGGVAIGDLDGDGLPEVVLTRPHGGLQLVRNLGGFRFEDATSSSGLAGDTTWGTGPALADLDGDGDLDLHVCGYDTPNRLWMNRTDAAAGGALAFEETAAAAGVAFHGASVQMAFSDYDCDGDVDGYLVTNRLTPRGRMKMPKPTVVDGRVTLPPAYDELIEMIEVPGRGYRPIKVGQADRLFENQGDASFKDVTGSSGIHGDHYGLAATWWDFDDDGDEDLYVSNDFWGPDRLYENGGDGSFADVAGAVLPHTPWYSMGSDAGDLDNDGRLDFMASDMLGTSHYRQKIAMGDMGSDAWFLEHGEPRQAMRNAVFLNSGAGRFREGAYLLGLAQSDWTWAVKMADLDEDGWLDVFLTNGMTRDWFNSDLRAAAAAEEAGPADPFWQTQPLQHERNLAFRNSGALSFEEIGAEWGLDHLAVSFGAALGDLDGDGDPDLVVNDFQGAAGVYRNESHGTNRMVIRLHGVASAPYGSGASVTVESAAGTQTRAMALSGGFMSSDEPLLHVGLGADAVVRRLSVRWPSGHQQSFDDLPSNQRFDITEPTGAPASTREPRAEAALFASAELATRGHVESEFDDFARQPLLPNRLSRLGPGVAWADVDGDGDDDFFIGGAAGQSGALYIQRSPGAFEPRTPGVLRAHSDREDMAPLFLDADGDGDVDLFIVSGSYEADPGDEELRDRLYLNDGTGEFVSAPDALPDFRDSGSVAAAADFDRDGDLDLFVGGRVVPGSYPRTPISRLLVNEGGRFVDGTRAAGASLMVTGLVTSACWTDVDDDGWIDLLVTHEWGAVGLWMNREGRLVESTEAAGLAEHTGWFNGIASRDLDGDGDIDFVVTNVGLNTKYHASPEHPTQIYFGKFGADGGTGIPNIIEAEFEGDEVVPVRGRSCSSNAMPHLAEQFPNFHEFAKAPLVEIYAPDELSGSMTLEAGVLESGVFLNDGAGRFEFHPLPRIAQIAPGFGVVLTELDGDGHADLVIAQNFFGPQPETGRMDGGVSIVLRGDGRGGFAPVSPVESGVSVDGDAMGLATGDANGDGLPDLVFAVNDGPAAAFLGSPDSAPRRFGVRLSGPAGNPTAVGARVTVRDATGGTQTAEVTAGGSYLSQSSGTLTFARPASGAITITVRWPDGRTETVEREVNGPLIEVD